MFPILDSNFYPGGPAGPGYGPGGPLGPGGPMGPGGSGGPPGGPPGPPAPQTQPLASNVLGKGGDRSLDQQYMQQSSQIFVFSTEWANRSATAVMDQQAPSIISWHESQPETKKQLEVSIPKFLQVVKSNHSISFVIDILDTPP